MRLPLLVASILLVCLMALFPPVRYSSGSSMESRGYHLNTATLFAELIVSVLTTGLFMTLRNRR